MPRSWTARKTRLREALPPVTFASIDRSIADLRATGLADRAVGLGDLIALPVLRTIDDPPVDPTETAAGRPVVDAGRRPLSDTFREKLFGAGARLPADHRGAGFRDIDRPRPRLSAAA